MADEKESPEKKEESPSRLTDEDILKRLSALRTPPEGIFSLKIFKCMDANK